MKFFNQFARIFGFKININNIIEEEKNKFEIFANKTKEKHRAWKDKKELIKNTFEDVVDRRTIYLLSYICAKQQIKFSYFLERINLNLLYMKMLH